MYVICPFCGLKIQEINNENNQKTHCCGKEISEIDYQMICIYRSHLGVGHFVRVNALLS